MLLPGPSRKEPADVPCGSGCRTNDPRKLRRRPLQPFRGLEAASGAHPPDPSQGRVTTFAFARLARAALLDARIETDAPSKGSIRSLTAGGSATLPPTVSSMPVFRQNGCRTPALSELVREVLWEGVGNHFPPRSVSLTGMPPSPTFDSRGTDGCPAVSRRFSDHVPRPPSGANGCCFPGKSRSRVRAGGAVADA